MRWQLLHQTAIGGMHIEKNMPCQDNASSENLGWLRIIVVADGHGSRRHFRSEKGSAIACEVALEEIKAYCATLSPEAMPTQSGITQLKNNILARWKSKVVDDITQNPWMAEELIAASANIPEAELARLQAGEKLLIPYGSTLVAGFATDSYWCGMQIGDGILLTIDSQGKYQWPMPESSINRGNRTASLCMSDPMPEFRHCLGNNQLVGMIVCTDGIEKAFPPMGEKVTSFAHMSWQAARQDIANAQHLLATFCERIALRSDIKDDVGIAIMADLDAPDITPLLSEQQIEREKQQAAAHLEEVQTIIDYTRKQLMHTDSEDEAQKLKDVLDRRLAERDSLSGGILQQKDSSHQDRCDNTRNSSPAPAAVVRSVEQCVPVASHNAGTQPMVTLEQKQSVKKNVVNPRFIVPCICVLGVLCSLIIALIIRSQSPKANLNDEEIDPISTLIVAQTDDIETSTISANSPTPTLEQTTPVLTSSPTPSSLPTATPKPTSTPKPTDTSTLTAVISPTPTLIPENQITKQQNQVDPTATEMQFLIDADHIEL